MAARSLTPRSARTRTALLDAAEARFAERGFAATRLEDVAQAVGIRRASIFYHFSDKRTLYEAVLERALGALRERVEAALLAPGPLAQRIEAAVGAWAETVVERPTLARLVLREVLDAGDGPGEALRTQAAPFAALFEKALAESRREPGWQGADAPDPVQIVSVIVGATVFFVGALPALAPGAVGPGGRAAHEAALRALVRRLLPTGGPSEPGP